jgi:hypothetical protein
LQKSNDVKGRSGAALPLTGGFPAATLPLTINEWRGSVSDAESDYLSPKEMRQWAEQELKDVARAAELRTREIHSLAEDYAAGRISPQQADERKDRYEHRWGEALRGCITTEGMTDEQILAKIDSTRKPFETWTQTAAKYKQTFGRDPDDEGPQR